VLLRARRERPCSRSTKERDEFAAFHCPMPSCLTEKDSTTGGSAAVRDFDPAYVSYGSEAAEMIVTLRRPTSALPRRRTYASLLRYVRSVPIVLQKYFEHFGKKY